MKTPAAPVAPAVKDDDVFIISEKGNRELKAGNTSLSAAELQVLVVVDGFSTAAELAKRVPGLTRDETIGALHKLSAAKLVASEKEADAESSGFSTIAVPAGFFSSLAADANAEADGGLSILKKKGFYVRIARQPNPERAVKEGWKPTVLIVDDDPDLQKLIRTYFMLEGIVPRAALKRDEIVLALRHQTMPDLILLDVNLPDANGFEVLAKLRQHPVLKTIPVIMFTAEATREAVLKGLQGGADGYVTKPFEPDMLITAVKTVLGLNAAKAEKKK
jgi:two-component system OmpR family response regulator